MAASVRGHFLKKKNFPTGSGGTQTPIKGISIFFPEVQPPEHEAEH